ncbi:MAG: FecR family protein [Smithellaceae bacterium]|nr:FecR domain-containing protein [Syntrophaceae bacterium]MDD4240358.1 FecR family protein [Smithellaceae bacterium]NLX52137.1 FecR domain-containing protein [Deltaproteobacteria bacterium]
MKKFAVTTGWMIAVLFFATLAWAAPVGKVTTVVGNVDLTPAGATEARAVAAGDAVNVGDILRTKGKAKAEITFANGNILRLAENTRLKITDYLSGKDKNVSVLNLLRGKIQNTVKSVGAGGRYEVHTPTAVCGVRGTVFYNTHANGASGAFFEEGDGYGYNPRNPKNIQTIRKGRAMIISGADQAPQVRDILPGELESLKMETNPASAVFQRREMPRDLGGRMTNTLDKYKPAPGDTKPYIPTPGVHDEPYHPPHPEPHPPYHGR